MLAASDTENPFRDSLYNESATSLSAMAEDSSASTPCPTSKCSERTLNIGRRGLVTLSSENVVIIDDIQPRAGHLDLCACTSSRRDTTTTTIPYFNILWAEATQTDLTIRYLRSSTLRTVPFPLSTRQEKVQSLHYQHSALTAQAQSWTRDLLASAYQHGRCLLRKRLLMLINPAGGTRGAVNIYAQQVEPVLAAANCTLDVQVTKHQGHAVEIARDMDISAYDAIVCCSGDGLPHEVYNGLGLQGRAALAAIPVVQIPCGSGNAMSWNLFGTDSPSLAALCVVKGRRMRLDLTSIVQDDATSASGQRRILSFLSQSVGLVAEVDLGTEDLRWMGSARFTYGFLARIMQQVCYPCDISARVHCPDKETVRDFFAQQMETTDLDTESVGEIGDAECASDGGDQGLPALELKGSKSKLPDDFVTIPGRQLSTFYAGNMALMAPGANFFPASLPHDGLLDLVTIDHDIGRVAAVSCLLAVENGKFFDMPTVAYRKVSAYRLDPLQGCHGKTEGFISIDGESLPFAPFQAEVHRGLGCTLSRSGGLYEGDAVVPKVQPGSGFEDGC